MYPEVSVIIPTYKRPELLARALESVGPACSVPHEVIVVDDCADGSAFETARQFNAQYFCKAGRHRGLSKSRNVGIGLSHGTYLTFLDDDDFFSPGGIDALYQTALAGFSFAFGDYLQQLPTDTVRVDLSQIRHADLLVCNRIPVGAYLIARSAIRRHFDEQMRSHEDWEFILHNVDPDKAGHIASSIVTIDKTHESDESMQVRRRSHFWLDFLSIYSRYPAPQLNVHRQQTLAHLGVNINAQMLGHADTI
jgi:glycosyltransferase involved in cell wall biosynthesis